ncbi:unnamed protein product [Euphydryas editha]|uniref:DDE Tnp4 domain-containing protein n=1 Tax=Euphydryas editha TaxID=104508 RepID=A0AAU9V3V2_EUPED|nr:unnamed protein product [Euphydryas editha]
MLCVNCNICVNTLRRYQVITLDSRVAGVLCSWVYPRVVLEEDIVCEACRDLAIFSVNENFQQDLSGNADQQAGPSHRGHTNVCLLCGLSTLRRRGDKILRSNPSELQLCMIAIIESRVQPRKITHNDFVCHPCWLRVQREARRRATADDFRSQPSASPQQEEPEVLEQQPQVSQSEEATHSVNEVTLPDYRRAANTNHHCVFPNCGSRILRSISEKLRAIILSTHNYYLPQQARVCDDHLMGNTWDTLFHSQNSYATFTVQQIQHVFSFVNAFNASIDFENVDEMDDRVFQYWIGRTKESFNLLLDEVPQIRNLHRGSLGLLVFLLKLRTGDSDERIAMLVNVPRRTLEVLMDKVREILFQDFVPNNLGINHMSRDELINNHTLLIPNGLYGNGTNTIVICDGTYIYVNKSSNYSFQKQTYSLHKYRNLLKPFLIVACDGYILDCFGPYKATTSDADIMNQLFCDGSALREYFECDDVFILDRGFRDSISLLEGCGFRAFMPESLSEGEHQLTTAQANKSRCVTICRWVVEAVNGHFKRDFKLLRQEYFHQSLPHMMQNFQIAAALLNRFGVRFENNIYCSEILEIIQERMDLENNLANMVESLNMNRRSSNFENICADENNLPFFPTLEYRDLVLFALGTYQLRQARSYYGEHVRSQGGYRIEVNRGEAINQNEPNPKTLIRGKIKSRHISRKQYYVYLLIENNIPGRTGIIEYCCSCLVGRRTIGCCAHTMTLVWYLGWARHQENISAPAGFLDEIFVQEDEQ